MSQPSPPLGGQSVLLKAAGRFFGDGVFDESGSEEIVDGSFEGAGLASQTQRHHEL